MSDTNVDSVRILADAGEIYSIGECIAHCRYDLQARQETALLYDIFGDYEESSDLTEISGVLRLNKAELNPSILAYMRPGVTFTLQLCDGRGLPVVVQGVDEGHQVRVRTTSSNFVP